MSRRQFWGQDLTVRHDDASKSGPLTPVTSRLTGEQRMKRRIEEAKKIPILRKLSLCRPRDELLPSLEMENPMRILRGAAPPPKIMDVTEAIREGLKGLHNALSKTNQQKDSYLKFAVQLESSHYKANRWMEDMGLLDNLDMPSNSVFFSLIAQSSAGGGLENEVVSSNDFIIAGIVLDDGDSLEVGNLHSKDPRPATRGRRCWRACWRKQFLGNRGYYSLS